MATFQDKTFANQEVLVDGTRYEACTFTNCTLVYKGGDLPAFVNCTFQETRLQLESEARQTLRYLNGLYRGGLSGQVEGILSDVQRGQVTVSKDYDVPDPALTGTNYLALAIGNGVILLLGLLFIAGLIYGFLTYPIDEVLADEEDVRPLAEEFPLEGMPILPDDLADFYDDARAEQQTRIVEYGWVDEENQRAHIPVEDAIDMLLADGIPDFSGGGE